MGIFSSSSGVSGYPKSQPVQTISQDANIKLPSQPDKKYYNISIGEGLHRVVFLVAAPGIFRMPYNMSKLIEISGLINRLNSLIPSLTLTKIIIPDVNNSDHGEYNIADKSIYVNSGSFNTPNYLHLVAHETGHRVYYKLVNDGEEWLNIFALALGKGNYEIVRDSKFLIAGEKMGHPYNGGTELFASAFAAYTLHPEQFLARINDKKNPAEMRLLGKTIWCYLRDKIFNGKVFSASDPFSIDNSGTMLKSLGPDRIYNSLKSCLGRVPDPYGPDLSKKAIETMVALSKSNERCFSLAARCLMGNSVTDYTRIVEVLARTDAADERFLPIVLDQLRTPVEDPFLLIYIDYLAQILVKIKSENTVPGIITVLDKGSIITRDVILQKIIEFRVNDPRIVRKLRDMLKNTTNDSDRMILADCLNKLGVSPAAKK